MRAGITTSTVSGGTLGFYRAESRSGCGAPRWSSRQGRGSRKDRASFIRELLADGVERDLEDEVVLAYREGRLSLSGASRRVGLDPWAWFDLLRRRNETLNVGLEDWIDSQSAV